MENETRSFSSVKMKLETMEQDANALQRLRATSVYDNEKEIYLREYHKMIARIDMCKWFLKEIELP